MPFETLVVISAVISAFLVFGLVLAWADFRTRRLH